jgi:hypothetical protein
MRRIRGAKLSVHMGTSDEYLEILHKLARAWAAENTAEYEGLASQNVGFFSTFILMSLLC